MIATQKFTNSVSYGTTSKTIDKELTMQVIHLKAHATYLAHIPIPDAALSGLTIPNIFKYPKNKNAADAVQNVVVALHQEIG